MPKVKSAKTYYNDDYDYIKKNYVIHLPKCTNIDFQMPHFILN